MKNRILMLIAFLAVMDCGCKHDQPAQILPPAAAVLLSPTQNEACVTGVILSGTESEITFMWNAAKHTGSYQLVIKNLLSDGIENYSTTDPKLEVTLLRGTPYSWYVVSKSSQSEDTAKSEIWKFYNSGAGTVSYAPFPADLTSPAFGQSITASTGVVDLKWNAGDVDGDISDYDVYLDTSAAPGLLKSGIKDMQLNDVEVSSGHTYYWKIVTKDSKGNTSASDVSKFTVN